MTRHIIAVEGIPSILPGIRLKPGALRLKDEKIPVSDNFDWEAMPIGFATDLQRDENTNEVSVEITLFDGNERSKEEKFYDYSFAAKNLVEELVPATDEDEEYRLILQADLWYVAIVPSPVWPKQS